MLSAIKRVVAVCLCAVLALSLCACGGNGGAVKNEIDLTDPSIYTIDCVTAMGEGKALGLLEERKEPEEVTKAADELLKRIEANPDTVKAKEGSKTYYVSNDGDDNNDGLSPEKPMKTILAANAKTKSGDAVLLKRGNFWREQIVGKEGVAYGAYGEGNNPTIYTSIDGLAVEWQRDEENEHLWVADIGTTLDVGHIVFNHGKIVGNRKTSKDGLIKPYNFFLEKRGTKLYVYYDGDITKDFYSIEIGIYKNIIIAAENGTYQNLRLMYSGSFAIHVGSGEDNVNIQGCIMGYIGGGGKGTDVRLGNGVELWGSVNGLCIDLCHVYQVYDAGLTFQWKTDTTGDITEENIAFTNNLLEYNVYNFEYFLSNSTGNLKNIEISGNVMRNAGYGWGTLSRPDKTTPASIKAGGVTTPVINFVIKDNIISHGFPSLVNIHSSTPGTIPQFIGNTYVINKTRNIYKVGKSEFKAADNLDKTAKDIFGDQTGKLIIY